MKMKSLLLGAVAICTALSAAPAMAQGAACLQNNRIWSWNVVNPRTMIVTDRDHRRFMVRMSGGCYDLDNSRVAIAFRTSTNLGCLGQGDRVLYRSPSFGRSSCFVTSVRPLYRPYRAYRDYDRDYDRDYNREDDRDRDDGY